MSRCTVSWLAALAMLPATESVSSATTQDPETHCPEGNPEVVVRAHQFSDGRSYSFMITNNGTTPILVVQIGRGGRDADTFIKNSYSTQPVSVGSPNGWSGTHVQGRDPRRLGSHSPTLVSYLWTAEDPESGIQPGRSLAGFTVQLPTPQEAEIARVRFWELQGIAVELRDPNETRRAAQPDLTEVPFRASLSGTACIVMGRVVRDQA